MRKDDGDGKDVYRKRAFIQKFNRPLQEELQQFKEKISKKSKHLKNFFDLKKIYDENPDLGIILFCKDITIREKLIDLGSKGADIKLLWDVLKPPSGQEHRNPMIKLDKHPLVLDFLGFDKLSSDYNQMVEDFEKQRKSFNKYIKALKNAVKMICDLLPIPEAVDELRTKHPDFNEHLKKIQNELSEIVDLYIQLMPVFESRTGKISGYINSEWAIPLVKLFNGTSNDIKPVSQKSTLWNKKIVLLVNELKRIGYSDHQSYIKTAELLHDVFPDTYKDIDPDLIRQRYSYHSKKQK